MFEDLDFDDDFSDGDGLDLKSANKKDQPKLPQAADLAFKAEDESENFDANELLNFSDYRNKRQAPAVTKSALQQKHSTKDALNANKGEELDQEDDWGASDDWGADPVPKEVDLAKVDLKNTNLNKLSDADLAAHKRAMDKDFNKNQKKPGDSGFVYDKVVDFAKVAGEIDLEDDSWGEDDDEGYGESM